MIHFLIEFINLYYETFWRVLVVLLEFIIAEHYLHNIRCSDDAMLLADKERKIAGTPRQGS